MKITNNPIAFAWRMFTQLFRTTISRDVAMMNVAQQVLTALDVINQQIMIGPAPEGDAGGEWSSGDPNLCHWFQDLYVADDGSIFAITVTNGKLNRWPVAIAPDNTVTLGTPTEVMPVFATAKPHTLQPIKRTDGRYEGFAILGTAALNKDGDIDSRALFDTFVERFTGVREYVNIYHIGGDVTRIGDIDLIFREENLLVGHYVLDDNPLARAVGATLAGDKTGVWGGSIEFISDDEGTEVEVAPGVRANVYTSGTLRGFSIATCADGAAWGTAHLMTRTPPMNDALKEKIHKQLLGGDAEAIALFDQMLAVGNTRIADAITRTAEDSLAETTPVATPVTQEATPAVEQAVEMTPVEAAAEDMAAAEDTGDGGIVVDDALLQAVTAALQDSEWWQAQASASDELASRMTSLEQAVADLQTAAGGSAEQAQAASDQVQTATTDMTTRMTALEQTVAGLTGFYERNKPPTPQTATYRPGRSTPVQAQAVTPPAAVPVQQTLASQWRRPEKVFGPKSASR